MKYSIGEEVIYMIHEEYGKGKVIGYAGGTYVVEFYNPHIGLHDGRGYQSPIKGKNNCWICMAKHTLNNEDHLKYLLAGQGREEDTTWLPRLVDRFGNHKYTKE